MLSPSRTVAYPFLDELYKEEPLSREGDKVQKMTWQTTPTADSVTVNQSMFHANLSEEETEGQRSALELAVAKELRKENVSRMDAAMLASEMDVERRREYLQQTMMKVSPADTRSIESALRGPIAPHEHFSDSSYGADIALGPHGSFQQRLGATGRGLGKAAMFGAFFLPTAGVLEAGTPSVSAEESYHINNIDYAFPAASTGGEGGAHWTSNVAVKCFSKDPCEFTIYAVPNKQTVPIAQFPLESPYTLDSGVAAHLIDVAGAYMGLTGFSGAFLIDVISGDPRFRSRTVNNMASGSEVGLGVHPFSWADAIPAGEEAALFVNPELQEDGTFAYRAAIWLLAKQTTTVNYKIRSIHGHDGEESLAENSVTLYAGQPKQLNRILEKNGIEPGEDPIAILLSADKPVLANGQLVDNRGAQDAVSTSGSVGLERLVDMVAVDALGKFGVHWETELYGYNPHTEQKPFLLDFYYKEKIDGVLVDMLVKGYIMAPAKGGFHLPNILNRLGLSDVQGTLNITPCQGGYVGGRVYAQNADGGTSGLNVSHLTRLEAGGWRQGLHLFGLENHKEPFGGTKEGARTNIDVINPQDLAEAVYTGVIKDGATGEVFDKIKGRLPPKGRIQYNGLLEKKGCEGLTCEVEFRVFAGSIHAAAYTTSEETSLPDEEKHSDSTNQSTLVFLSNPFPSLEGVVFGPKKANPFEPVTLEYFATEQRLGGKIKKIEVDMNGDGDFDDAMDVVQTYRYGDIRILEFVLPEGYDGSASGATVPITIKATSQYNDVVTQTVVEDSYETTHVVEVGKISDMGIDWRTREDASAAVNAQITSRWDWYVDQLTQGANPSTPADVELFLGFTTTCDDTVYALADYANIFGARGCDAQGVLKGLYEAPFNRILEDVAEWVEPVTTKALTEYQTTTTDQ